MAKITRATQTIFGSAAGASQIAQFGSLAAGSPMFTTDPEVIQALGNYLTGWYGAVVGLNAPSIEDMNALCYLFAYQLSYLMQTGVPEYDAQTVYYIGSLASNGTGQVYASLTDANTGNPFTDTTNWRLANYGNYNKVVPSAEFPLLSSASITAGDSILVIADITETGQVLVNVGNVRIDCAVGKFINSTYTADHLVLVTGTQFRSSNINIKASGALGATKVALKMSSSDAIVSALLVQLNNAALALNNVLELGGDRNDITSGSIRIVSGTYTAPITDTGTNNDSRIRG